MNNSDPIFHLPRCKFFIDTNDFIPIEMVKPIFNEFEDGTIKHLNDIVKGVSFFMGNDISKPNTPGIIKFEAFEFNFKEQIISFYLREILSRGFHNWIKISAGSLKRLLWENLFHEIIYAMNRILRIDKSLINKAQDFVLTSRSPRIKSFVKKLMNGQESDVNYIDLHSKLWKLKLPPFGDLDLLYNKKMEQLQTPEARKLLEINTIKVLNEIRRNKLNYEYEYNLSELVNYILEKEKFRVFYRYDKSNRKELYYKVRREVLKFIKMYDIDLKLYKDSSNRTHSFLTHEVFERIKSACYQICLQKVKYEKMEEFTRFREFYSHCPICKSENSNHLMCENFYFSSKFSYFKDVLLERLGDITFLEQKNNDNEYFGVPCSDCYSLTNNIQGKFKDLNEIKRFIITYGSCPICSAKNHINYLTSLYYNESKKDLCELLKHNMDSPKDNQQIKLGIPCCICYKKVFGEDPPAYAPPNRD